MSWKRRKNTGRVRLQEETGKLPLCPWCRKALETVAYRRMHGGSWGKRHVYFCPSCSKVLGTSHRAFWLG